MVTDWLTQLLAQTPEGNTLEQLCHIGWTVLGRRRHEQMDVVRHHLTSKNLESILDCNLIQQFSQSVGYLPGQDVSSVLGTPDQMVVDVVHCAFGSFHIHMVIVAQAFCLGNRNTKGGATSSPDWKSGVSAAEIL